MPKSKQRKRENVVVEDEPGAEERFLRGVRKALNTPPTKRADQPKSLKAKRAKR